MIPSIVCLFCLSGRKVKGPKNEKTKDFIPDLNELPTGALSLDDIAENYSAVSRYHWWHLCNICLCSLLYAPHTSTCFKYMNMAYLYILNLKRDVLHTNPYSSYINVIKTILICVRYSFWCVVLVCFDISTKCYG